MIAENHTDKMTIKNAFAVLETCITTDHDYAWTWHCNFAVPMQDEGLDHAATQRAAARIMYNFFGVDMRQSPYWQSEWDNPQL